MPLLESLHLIILCVLMNPLALPHACCPMGVAPCIELMLLLAVCAEVVSTEAEAPGAQQQLHAWAMPEDVLHLIGQCTWPSAATAKAFLLCGHATGGHAYRHQLYAEWFIRQHGTADAALVAALSKRDLSFSVPVGVVHQMLEHGVSATAQ